MHTVGTISGMRIGQWWCHEIEEKGTTYAAATPLYCREENSGKRK
jgi:hypothetical protein